MSYTERLEDIFNLQKKIKNEKSSGYFPGMSEVIGDCMSIISKGFERSPLLDGFSAPLPSLGTTEIIENMVQSGRVPGDSFKRLAPESVQPQPANKRIRRDESERSSSGVMKVDQEPPIEIYNEAKSKVSALDGQKQMVSPPACSAPSSHGHLPQDAIIISDSRDVSPTSIPEPSGIAALQESRASEGTDRTKQQHQDVAQALPGHAPRDKARAIVDMAPTNLFLDLVGWTVQNHEHLAAILNGKEMEISGDVKILDVQLDKES